jgi:hypothetical protein
MTHEEEQKLSQALNELHNSNAYRELCKVVMDLTGTTIDNPTIERMIDETLICRGAWIYDTINGEPKRGKTLTQKIRKTLGYSYP